jgi:aquaporin Z
MQRYVAEVVGTFMLVAIGSMTILAANTTQAPLVLVAGFGFGLALLAAIGATAHISGGHYNPAVTLAALLDKRLGAQDAVAYLVAQVVGALLASLFILVIADREAVLSTRNLPAAGMSGGVAFLIEVVLTAMFIMVILVVSKRGDIVAGVVIPLTLVVIHIGGIPLTGASVNPARSLGPAVVGGDLQSLWIYLTAPFVGGALAFALYRVLGAGEPPAAPPALPTTEDATRKA